MDRMNIQFKSPQMPIPAKIILIPGGLFVVVLAIYKISQECSMEYILIALVGISTFLMYFDPFSSRKPYLLINDSKIEYRIRNIGRPWIVIFDEIDSSKFDDKRLKFIFNLTNDRRKTLFLRMFPNNMQTEIKNTIKTELDRHEKMKMAHNRVDHR